MNARQKKEKRGEPVSPPKDTKSHRKSDSSSDTSYLSETDYENSNSNHTQRSRRVLFNALKKRTNKTERIASVPRTPKYRKGESKLSHSTQKMFSKHFAEGLLGTPKVLKRMGTIIENVENITSTVKDQCDTEMVKDIGKVIHGSAKTVDYIGYGSDTMKKILSMIQDLIEKHKKIAKSVVVCALAYLIYKTMSSDFFGFILECIKQALRKVGGMFDGIADLLQPTSHHYSEMMSFDMPSIVTHVPYVLVCFIRSSICPESIRKYLKWEKVSFSYSFNDANTFIQATFKIIKDIGVTIAKMFGYDDTEELLKTDKEYSALCCEVNSLIEQYVSVGVTENPVHLGPAYAARSKALAVERFENLIVRIREFLTRNKASKTIYDAANTLLRRSLEGLAALGETSSESTRPQPVAVIITGKAGIGKTRLTNRLAKDLVQKMYPFADGEKYGNYVYTRNSAIKFWSNYANQPITVWPEIGAYKNSKNDDTGEFRTFSGIVDTTPCEVNMAAVMDKGRQFTSYFVLANTNLGQGLKFGDDMLSPIIDEAQSELKTKDQIGRRIYGVVHAKLKPEFYNKGDQEVDSSKPRHKSRTLINKKLVSGKHPDEYLSFKMSYYCAVDESYTIETEDITYKDLLQELYDAHVEAVDEAHPDETLDFSNHTPQGYVDSEDGPMWIPDEPPSQPVKDKPTLYFEVKAKFDKEWETYGSPDPDMKAFAYLSMAEAIIPPGSRTTTLKSEDYFSFKREFVLHHKKKLEYGIIKRLKYAWCKPYRIFDVLATFVSIGNPGETPKLDLKPIGSFWSDDLKQTICEIAMIGFEVSVCVGLAYVAYKTITTILKSLGFFREDKHHPEMASGFLDVITTVNANVLPICRLLETTSLDGIESGGTFWKPIKVVGYGIATGTSFLIPHHYVVFSSEQIVKLGVIYEKNSVKRISIIPSSNVTHANDVALVENMFERRFKDISSHFVTGPFDRSGYLYVAKTGTTDQMVISHYSSKTVNSTTALPSGREVDMNNEVLATCLPGGSKAGDCGRPCFVSVKGVLKVVGIHTSGSGKAGEVSVQTGFSRIDSTILLSSHPEMDMSTTRLQFVENTPFPVSTAGRHSKVKSLIYDKIEGNPSFKERSRLYRTTDGDPFCKIHEALSKPLSYRPEIASTYLYHVTFVLEEMFGKEKFTAATYEEAVRGMYDDHADRIKDDTSAGYPYSFWERNNPGKFDFIGNHDTEWINGIPQVKYGKVMHEHTMKVLEDLKSGKDPESVYLWFPKPELLPKEKVVKYRTRGICATPLPLLIAKTMLFGKAYSWLVSANQYNMSRLGINPCGPSWTTMARMHRSVCGGKNNLPLDGAEFDYSKVKEFYDALAEAIGMLFTDKELNKARYTAVAHLYSFLLAYMSRIYRVTGSLPTGDKLTSFLNTVHMASSQVGSLHECGVPHSEVGKGIICSFYGDDSLLTVHDRLLAKVTPEGFTEAMAAFGVRATGSDKGTPKYCGLEEVDFLKRGFVKDGDIFNAPLELRTIMEIPQWTSRQRSDAVFKDNLRVVQIELSQHGETVFNNRWGAIVSAIESANKDYIGFRDYNILTYKQAQAIARKSYNPMPY